MGLDITAYSKIHFLHELPDGEDHSLDHPFLYPTDSPLQEEGIKKGCYGYEDKFQFRAGSYSGYSYYRTQLAKMVHGVPAEAVWENPERYTEFVEQIHFSDCDGIIGPKTSEKLAKDYDEFRMKAEQFTKTLPDGDYWLSRYEDWSKAFHLASDGGVVEFH